MITRFLNHVEKSIRDSGDATRGRIIYDLRKKTIGYPGVGEDESAVASGPFDRVNRERAKKE
jgi:hypothetical protein